MTFTQHGITELVSLLGFWQLPHSIINPFFEYGWQYGIDTVGYYRYILIIIMILRLIIRLLISNQQTKIKFIWILRLGQMMWRISFSMGNFLGYEGGFPIRALVYPEAGGSDSPPLETLPLFLANLVIWLIVTWLIIRYIPNTVTTSKKYRIIMLIVTIILTCSGFVKLLLIFD